MSKILTIGMNPYAFLSHGKLHSWIIKDLFLNKDKIMSMCWGFDKDYFVPDVNGNFTYDFEKYKIPLIPFERSPKESVIIYEVINSIKPDIVITIGDIYDFGFMKSIKIFYSENIKWINITANYQYPIPEDAIEAFDSLDASFCTSRASLDEISTYYKGDKSWSFVGCDEEFYIEEPKTNTFRIFANGKNCQSDNLSLLIEICHYLKGSKIPELELYIHTNCYEKGEYDMEYLKKHFDFCNTFLKYPDKYVSVLDGIPAKELAKELSKSHLFVSCSLASSTGITVFEAMAAGVLPLVTDNDVNRDIFKNIENTKQFLIKSVPLMTVGHSYLHVPCNDDLANKIIYFYENYKNMSNIKRYLKDFVLNNSKRNFINNFRMLLEETKSKKDVVFLESVTGDQNGP